MRQVKTLFALSQVKNNALPRGRYLFQGRMKLKACVVNQRTKHIARYILSMNAHEHWFGAADVAHDHRQVHVSVDHILVGDGPETFVDRKQLRFHYSAHEHLFAEPITYQ